MLATPVTVRKETSAILSFDFERGTNNKNKLNFVCKPKFPRPRNKKSLSYLDSQAVAK